MKKLYAFSIPTGIGAEHGGYAGDAGMVARKFAKYFDLVVNPNVVNAGSITALTNNMYYLEGWAFDRYLARELYLKKREKTKLGVIFDCEIPDGILNIHKNTIEAYKIVKGYDIITTYTHEPVGIEFSVCGGVSTGSVKNPQTLLKSAKELLNSGADAIAIVCYFPDTEDSDYMQGVGVDPIGGVEGVLSHLISSEFNVPSAHAPAFSSLDVSFNIENPKLAAETVSATYLPCVLDGLMQSPSYLSQDEARAYEASCRFCEGVFCAPSGLIVPASALGSYGVLGAIKNNIPIYAVKNNSVLDVNAEKMGIEAHVFESYDDCLESLICGL